jgi:hypothetical protein
VLAGSLFSPKDISCHIVTLCNEGRLDADDVARHGGNLYLRCPERERGSGCRRTCLDGSPELVAQGGASGAVGTEAVLASLAEQVSDALQGAVEAAGDAEQTLWPGVLKILLNQSTIQLNISIIHFNPKNGCQFKCNQTNQIAFNEANQI